MKEGIGQFNVIGFGVLGVGVEGGEDPVGDGVRVVPIEWVVVMGVSWVEQGEVFEGTATCLADVKGNITKHVAFYVADETPQTLIYGLLDERLDDEMSLAGACTSDYLNIFVEGRRWKAKPLFGGYEQGVLAVINVVYLDGLPVKAIHGPGGQ